MMMTRNEDKKPYKPALIRLQLCVVTLLFLLVAVLGTAGDYALDYYVFGLDGASSQTLNYHFSDLLQMQGVSAETQSSANYAISSAIGPDATPAPRVTDWMLY